MKIAVALVVAFAGLAGDVRADCLNPMKGAVEASLQVQSCRIVTAPRPDKRRLARIRVSGLDVQTVLDPTDDPEVLTSYAPLVENISTSRVVYVEVRSDEGCASFPEGRQVVASIQVLCCDTIPHRGLCALPGPIVRLE